MRPILNVLYNCHWVIPGEAARSAQPYIGFWEHHLRSNGIRGLINLRGVHPTWNWWQKEELCCRKLGIAHINISLNSRMLPTKAQLLELLDAFDRVPRSFMIKCSGGQDRTSFASALFLLHNNGWVAFQAAEQQFCSIPYLHVPRADQKWARQFLDYAQADAGNVCLAHWIRSQYDPLQFQQWLFDHGLGRSFRGLNR
jgi:hypothetical protein